jgi:hypothetical protein
MDRTLATTGTQRDIAGMENALGQRRLDQQGDQFDRSHGLDAARALDSSQRGWAELGRPTYGPPEYNTQSKQYEPTLKVPAVTPTGPNPLESLQGAQRDRAAAAGMGPGVIGDGTPTSPFRYQQPASTESKPATTSSSPFAGMSDRQLYNLQGRASGQALPVPQPAPQAQPSSPAPVQATPVTRPMAPITAPQTSFLDRATAALTPAPNSPGMVAVRDIGGGLSAVGNALGFNRNWGQGFRSLFGGETPEQVRARRAAAAGQ